MHDAAFDAAGIDARYVLLRARARRGRGGGRGRARADWLGLGVTAPYKRVVAALCDEVERDATDIGAVNNVTRTDDGRLVGFNTDAPGFRVGDIKTIRGQLPVKIRQDLFLRALSYSKSESGVA